MECFHATIPDIMRLQPLVFEDERGSFMETYNYMMFEAAGCPFAFVQDNYSRSHKGVLRGLHYQIKQAQGKLLRTISGEIFDVAVDIRKNSPYFGQWVGTILSASSYDMLWIPPGFAHGFYVLSEWAEITYKVTDYYAPAFEQTILWNDPQLAINWPLLDGQQPFLSSKDTKGKLLSEAEVYVGDLQSWKKSV